MHRCNDHRMSFLFPGMLMNEWKEEGEKERKKERKKKRINESMKEWEKDSFFSLLNPILTAFSISITKYRIWASGY